MKDNVLGLATTEEQKLQQVLRRNRWSVREYVAWLVKEDLKAVRLPGDSV